MRVENLSHLTSGEKPEEFNDELSDAYLFSIEMIPKWLEPLVSLMFIGNFKQVPARLVERSKLYSLLVDILCKQQCA